MMKHTLNVKTLSTQGENADMNNDKKINTFDLYCYYESYCLIKTESDFASVFILQTAVPLAISSNLRPRNQ